MGFHIVLLRLGVLVLRGVKLRVSHKILFNFWRDTRFFEPIRICMTQYMRRNLKFKMFFNFLNCKAHGVIVVRKKQPLGQFLKLPT